MPTIIERKKNYPDWDTVAPLFVGEYVWGGDYRPETTAKIVLLEGQGFLIRMQSMEMNPTARYTADDSPVHEDSCMEFFVDFNPGRPEPGYLNFEVNANGAMHCGYGPGRGGRPRLIAMGHALPKVKILRDEASWLCEYLVSFELINSIFGKNSFAAGDTIRANFYKCGDKTPIPHFGSWNPVTTSASPDFHRPECFGVLTVGEIDV